MIKTSQWRESHAERRLEIEINLKVADCEEKYQRGKINNHSKVIRDQRIRREFPRSTSSTRIGWRVLMMDVKITKQKYFSERVDQRNIL